MNNNIMVAVKKIEKIIEDLGTEYTWQNCLGQDIPYDEYEESIPQERALADRNRMLDVLGDFYSNQNLNDFITLFGVYCNHYIRYNLHTKLDDKDFGIKGLWGTIQNENLRKYLSLIQEGINYRKINCFKESVTVFSQYSLPYLYLFLDAANEVFIDRNVTAEQKMALFYNNMDKELREYAIGNSKYTQNSSNPAVDENPLPYLCFMSQQDGIVKAMMSHYQTLKEIVITNHKSFEQESNDYINFQNFLRKVVQINDENEKEQFLFSLQVLFEKLHCLDILQHVDNKQDIADIEAWKNDAIVYRLDYLNIPTKIPTTVKLNALELFSNKMELIKRNEQLKEANARLEQTIESKNALIDHHAHNWKHIVYPKTVKEVAEALYAEGNIEYANRLFKAYNSENILQHDLQLLRLSHASSQTEMQEAFRKDILLSNARSGVGMKKIVVDSLDTVLFRIIMENVDTSYSLQQVKTSISAFNNMDQLRKSYTDDFIIGEMESESLLEWFNTNIYKLNLQINFLWEEVKVKTNSAAYTQLVEICINLIHNALNYGVKSKHGFLNIKLETEQVNGTNYYTLVTENPVDSDSAFCEGSNQGLKSIQHTLEKLNKIDSQNGENNLSIEIEDKRDLDYRVKLYFKEKLLLKRRV